MGDPAPVYSPDDVTSDWLSEVLTAAGVLDTAQVVDFDAEDIGTGQVGANVRFTLRYDSDHTAAPGSVVGKFAARDDISRATGIATLTYETEVAFYRDLAPTVDVSRPHCYLAALESGTANVVVVMEDLAPAEQGDQIIGCSVEQATLAVDEAVRLHGPRWGDATLKELTWLDRSTTQGGLTSLMGMMWGGFVERYRATLDDVTIEAGSQLVASADRLREHTPKALTAIHYDYRLDNMLFHPEPTSARPLVVVDWQTVQLGLGAADVA